MATSNIGFQSFYQSQLTSAISNTDLTIPLDVLPTPSEGYLVIESTVAAQREIIYYTSKTGTAVVVPSGAGNGRGFDGTTAVSHTQGATVIMAPIGAMFGNQAIKDMLGVTTDVTGGWDLLASGTPSIITALGNRSYTVLIPSADTTSATSVGMRLKLPRTGGTTPTQCTDLESGSSQYFNDTSVSGMTFTDDFTVSAWVKLESYGAVSNIASRYNGTSGWILFVQTDGTVILSGYNASSANFSRVISYQSLPLNKWVHVAALLDMSSFTAAAATAETAKSWITLDGVEVPASVARAGTNPTALVQAGNLEIGAANAINYFDGKIAQVAIYSTRVLQATIRASMNQTLTGSEISLVSAYKLDQASGLNDLSANANNLTAQGSPTYASDTPFTNSVTGTSVTAGTTNYGIITAQTFSTDTTYTVQIPEGETLPTTGGIGALSYSTQKTPYGFPGQQGKWVIESIYRSDITATVTTNYIWVAHTANITIPTGSWQYGLRGTFASQTTGATSSRSSWVTLASATPTGTVVGTIDGGNDYPIVRILNAATGATSAHTYSSSERDIDLSASTTFTSYGCSDSITATETVVLRAVQGAVRLFARNAYL